MKNEIYEYSCPSKRITTKKLETDKTTTPKDDLVGYISIFFILFVFSLPMLLTRIWFWSIVFVTYIILLFFSRVDKDPYSKTMLFFGSTTLYLCVVLSYLVITESFKRFQVSSLPSLLILSAFCVVFYEIIVLINIVFKRYTARAKNEKISPAIYTTVGVSCGGIIGALVSRQISPHLEKSLWSVWLGLITCSLLFSVSFLFFQKYILYKVIRKKKDSHL